MLKRLLTAIPLILFVSLAFVLPGIGGNIFFFLMAMGMVLTGAYECLTMLDVPCKKCYLTLIGVCTAIFLCNAWLFPCQYNSDLTLSPRFLSSIAVDLLSIFLFCMATACVIFKKGCDKPSVLSAITAIGIFIYVSWSLQFMAKIYYTNWCFFPNNDTCLVSGRNLLIFLIATAKMADVGAYFLGSLTKKMPGGNHKLALKISPQKSYEGLLGGILFSVGTAIALAKIPNFLSCKGCPVFSLPELIMFGILAATIGLLGDLAESAIKRAGNFKDSGHLPGIGGILDVLDSLIPLAPLFYAYILLTPLKVLF